jgi:hypothetical protein
LVFAKCSPIIAERETERERDTEKGKEFTQRLTETHWRRTARQAHRQIAATGERIRERNLQTANFQSRFKVSAAVDATLSSVALLRK